MRKIFNWCVNFIRTLDWAEVFRYFVVGVCTTSLNLLSFWLFSSQIGLNALISNVLAWVISTMFAFVTNCFYVFRIRPAGSGEFFRFMFGFFGERLFTLGIEEVLILVFITWLKLPKMPVKFVTTCITIILNYIISKFIVFRIKEEESASNADD